MAPFDDNNGIPDIDVDALPVNIDLLFSRENGAGLIASMPFPVQPDIVLFSQEDRVLSLEMKDMVSLGLNIPVEEHFIDTLAFQPFLFHIVVEDQNVLEASLLPLLVTEHMASPDHTPAIPGRLRRRQNAGQAMATFLRRVEEGQPVHRHDPGDESVLGGIVNEGLIVAPHYAPQLARQIELDRGQVLGMRGPQNAPRGPAGPGMGGPGGMGSSLGAGRPQQPYRGGSMRGRSSFDDGNDGEDDRT